MFDMTPPQGHQLDLRVKLLLVFCSAHYTLELDMPHNQIYKKIDFWPPSLIPGA